MCIFRLLALALIGILAISCNERDSEAKDKKLKDLERSSITQSDEPEIRRPQRSQTSKQTPDYEGSASKILATCDRLKRGDDSGVIRFAELKEAYIKLALLDPVLALEQFGNPDAFYAIGPALYGVVNIVAANNPELLVTWLNQSISKYEDAHQATPLISVALNQLAAANPEKALEAFRNLNIPDTERKSVISALFRGLGASDPLAVINLVSSLDPSLASFALSGAAEGAMKSDPILAEALASKIPDSEARQNALDSLFAEWFKTDAKLAKEKLMKMDSKVVEDILVGGVLDSRSLLYSMSRSDPLTLLSLLDEIYPTSVNRTLFEKSVSEIVNSQPERTFATISQLPEGEIRLSLYKSAYASLAKADSERALAMFALEKDPAIRAAALPQIANSIGTGGMEASLKLLEKLNSGEERSAAFSSAFNAIVHSDLESAANYLVDSKNLAISLSPEEKERGFKAVAFRLASTSLDEARDWMSKLPQEEQPHAMTGIASQMAQRDVRSLGEYLNSIEKNQVWAAGVRVLISTVESGDADTANKWKQILKDTKLNKP